MLDRRRLIGSAAAATVASVVGPRIAAAQAAAMAGAPPATGEAAKLNAWMDAVMQEYLTYSPETRTSVGMDKGPFAAAKSQLDDRSLAFNLASRERMKRDLDRLKAIRRDQLTGLDVVNYDTVMFMFALGVESNDRFPYVGGPYVISQLTGAYQGLPDFLDSQHQIETKADADAYLARLKAFPIALDQEIETTRHDVALGVIPPDFILDKTLTQMEALRSQPASAAPLVQSVVRRAKAKGIAGDYATPATQIYETAVLPAIDRQIALVKALRARTTHAAGVGSRLKDGPDFYAFALEGATTTKLSPAEIHKTGLDLVTSLSAQIDTLQKTHGMTQGTVGERLRGMYADPKFRYPNTDEGKDKLLADLNEKVKVVRAKLPAYFGVLPKAPLEIKRVPKAIEAGAPGGYYMQPALDGSRPGMYYINLRDTAEVPSWTLPTLTYHEGIPGHHLQLSIQSEAPLPILRKIAGNSAYFEGWALYAEQFAATEMDMYHDDPFGRIGFLHDAMFRAVRLVVDTGLHSQGWSREQAVKYFVDTLGDQEASAITEVERYCVWPGQACSYMVGKIVWLKAREGAKAKLGSKFDIRAFHDAGLTIGAVPMEVLSDVIDAWTAKTLAA